MGENFEYDNIIATMDEWACFRELLARHEGKNKSQLDKSNDKQSSN